MKLPQLTKQKWNYTLLAFFLPFIAMCTMMLIRQFEPFGSVSMLYSDMYHQYYPFFVDFRRALLSGESLLYTWNIGLGMDYLGLASYYLASPLNLLCVLVPESLTLEYFSLLAPLKMGFAGMFFAIFLKNLFKRDDWSIAVFGSFYALCAWSLGYHWNIMWMDTFALLPLVALGTVALLRDRKFILYTLSLFFSVCANYYIGFFTCIFVALVFFCYQICRWKDFKKFFIDLGIIALFSILAIGMTAFLELPTFAALQTTQSSVNKFPEGFKLNIADENTWMGLLDAMRQVAGNMNGGIVPSYKEGLPNLYCGVITNVLAFLFLTSDRVKLRDKLCSAFLLVFFNLSFIIRQLDYIWHGFHFTNMIPYRFSFLYSFVMLYMAYRAYLSRNKFQIWQVIIAFMMALAAVLCANDLKDGTYWAYNGVFLLLYLCIFLYPLLMKTPAAKSKCAVKRKFVAERKSRKNLSAILLLCVMVLEIGLNMVNFGSNFTGTTVTDYPRGTVNSEAIIDYMEEREQDNLFYRAETTHSQTLNDGALNGYKGISTFTSSANVNVTLFMQALGYGAKNTYNRYCFEESSPVAKLFLGLKYMLERQDKVEENTYFEDVKQFGKVHLLQNNAYLPLGFLTDPALADLDFTNDPNHLQFQNELLKAAAGIDKDVWSFVTGNHLSILATDVTLSSQTQNGYCSYKVSDSTGGTIVYRYVADREGLFCIDLNQSKRNKLAVYKNNTELYSETYSLPQSLSVADVVPGDVIEVKLTCTKGESGNVTLHAGILDPEVFWGAYYNLSTSTLELTTFENTYVAGSIYCDRDGLLYTSIPQNGNWSVLVDGRPAQISLVGNVMIGVPLTEGVHRVEFIYRNTSFIVGCVISVACLAALAVLCFLRYRKSSGKYQN